MEYAVADEAASITPDLAVIVDRFRSVRYEVIDPLVEATQPCGDCRTQKDETSVHPPFLYRAFVRATAGDV